ncbi:MAG: glycosyltransferase family 2 protein, partial [Patescibacteria group bacterium]
MKVSVVIPSYNTERLLEKNLPVVLAAAKNPKNKIAEVILVDDASPDASATLVKRMFPQIKFIRHKINRGFSASVNTGVRGSRGDLICLLNTDVLPEENFLQAVLPHFENQKVFAVSLNEGGYSWARGFIKDGYIGHEPGPKDNKAHDTFWVSGGSAVLRRNIWKKLGGMDERLLSPFYWEDLDLCYRAAKRGY